MCRWRYDAVDSGCLARGTKVFAPLVFAEGKEYNKRRSFGEGAESLLIERT